MNNKFSMSQNQLLKKLALQEVELRELRVKYGHLENKISLIEQLENEIDNLTNIIELMPGNVYWKNTDGKFLGCNENFSKIIGLTSPREIVGKSNQDLLDPSDSKLGELAYQTDLKVLLSGKIHDTEEIGLNSDKELAVYLSQKIPLHDSKKQLVGILGLSVDITERKKIEEDLKIAKEQAEALSRNQSEFIANMSHDVKTPLSGIIGISELLTYCLKGQELEHAQTLLASSRQLLSFFDNCLEIFRLENNDVSIVNEAVHIPDLINDIKHLFWPAIQAKGLALHTEVADNARTVVTCKPLLFRVLLNLLGNAVKFSHQGAISIKAHLTPAEHNSAAVLKFAVSDTGIGIPADKQQVIFERFTRLVPSYKGTYDGSGIGLYIVKKFITALAGEIYIQSEVGKGSEFTILLPVVTPQSDENKITDTNDLSSITSNALEDAYSHATVLVVEDNIVVQRIQTALLTSMNCMFNVANSGEQALEQFEPGKYDLIFMDIGLPGIQGDVAARLIRKMEQGSGHHAHIIALTAHTIENAEQYCQSVGIDALFSKPLSLEQMKQIIENQMKEKNIA